MKNITTIVSFAAAKLQANSRRMLAVFGIIAMAAIIVLTGCPTEADDSPKSSKPKITMASSDVSGTPHTIELKGTGTVKIKWADGTETEVVLDPDDWIDPAPTGPINGTVTITGGDITGLVFFDLSLKSLNISGYKNIEYLDCSNNNLPSLNVSGLNKLEILDCSNNILTSLNVSGCTALTELYCDNNNLTSLNVSGLNKLEKLYCNFNDLTSLNVSGCTALRVLGCDNNNLTSLNVSECTALTGLNCSFNGLSDTALDTVFGQLPTWSAGDEGNIYINDNPGTGGCDPDIAEDKYWNVYK